MNPLLDSTYLLLSSSAKTKKAIEFGYRNFILFLAPHSLSGTDLCKYSTKECRSGCLFYAGRGIMRSVLNGRLQKTDLLNRFPILFLQKLNIEIRTKPEKSVIRLNGTSDYLWEKLFFPRTKINVYSNNYDYQFVEYTKYPFSQKKEFIAENPNVDLVYSYSGTQSSMIQARKYLANGNKISLVASEDKKIELLEKGSWNGYPTVDGDLHDLTFLHPVQSVLVLSAKGRLKKAKKGKFRLD